MWDKKQEHKLEQNAVMYCGVLLEGIVMEYIKLNVGDMDENCYIAYENGVGFAVDPGADALRIKNEAERRGILISAIFLTHGHFDHVGAVKELKEH